MKKLIGAFIVMMISFESSNRAFGAEQQWCYGDNQCPNDYVCEGGGGWSGTPGKCYPKEQHSCWETSECSAGYYCIGAESYKRGRCTVWPPVDKTAINENSQPNCAFYPEICTAVESAERCWYDEDCAYPKRCDRKSEYIPGYCV